VTVVRGELFARLRFTNRPETADRTRVKELELFDFLAMTRFVPIPWSLLCAAPFTTGISPVRMATTGFVRLGWSP
jgi:hypothetical protein